jgi:RNA-directed DNA polymerase
LTKRNVSGFARHQTQSWDKTMSRLTHVRENARMEKQQKFTALLHHVGPELLYASFYQLKRQAAKGVDGMHWHDYHEDLDARLMDLHQRLHSGRYKPKPARRVYIPKGDGTERPLSIQCVEDKLVQQAVVSVLNEIYETDFTGFSYGFRPGRSQHDALDALGYGMSKRKVNWVLDLDIRQFFDTVEHDWLIRMIQHRVQDKRLIKLIIRWIKVGVVDSDGKRQPAHRGVPQGAVISPLLSNIYLHYVFDQWSHQWRQREAIGDVIIVRYADDCVLGFQHKWEAEKYRVNIQERLRKFGLALHPEKTRLIRFGRFATEQCKRRGEGKPKTFDFLGFTHYCTVRLKGDFKMGRKTIRKRLVKQVKSVQTELRRRMHDPVALTLKWLRSVLTGHMNYYSVPGNLPSVMRFREEIVKRWFKMLRRRSQRHRVNWANFSPWIKRRLPKVRTVHAHPEMRFHANHSK